MRPFLLSAVTMLLSCALSLGQAAPTTSPTKAKSSAIIPLQVNVPAPPMAFRSKTMMASMLG